MSVISNERVLLAVCGADGVALEGEWVKVLLDLVESTVIVGGNDLVGEAPSDMDASVPVTVCSSEWVLVGVM